MEQNFKPITKQLLIAAIILSSVTILSFGIRHVRFSTYRADIAESTPSARPSDIEDQSQPKQLLNADAKPDYYQKDSYIADTKSNPQHTDVSDWDEKVPADDYSEVNADSINYDKAVLKTESFNGDYAKAEGKKGLQKISLSNHEELYFSEEGEFWYVSKEPDGSTTKMQVQIDDYTSELTAVNGGYYAKQEPLRIPLGDYENIYLTEKGDAWYVSEQPDGDTLKIQVQMD